MQVDHDRDEQMRSSQSKHRETARQLIEHSVQLTAVTPVDKVIVVGCEHIEVMLELMLRGFVDVTCRAAAGGPSAAEGSADLILAPAIIDAADLAAILARLGRALRPDAVFLFAARNPLGARRKVFGDILSRHGCILVREHAVAPGCRLLCCRRLRTCQAQAA